MISTIKKVLYMNKIKNLLKQHQITVLHFIPGRVRLASPHWKDETYILRRIIEELRSEERIFSVVYTKETGSLLITYNKDPVHNEKQIESWFERLSNILSGN
ncbi:HMA2 domain-containing protein [Evansella vedderi]|nr:metal ABC transporter ATPase [Evansella vedderi]